jgi:PASTA domain/Glucodextranase, domain B
MRRFAPALLLLATASAVGCGQGDDPAPAGLAISSPADSAVVHEDSVEVRGRVRPAGASVTVLGRRADVSGREFRAVVPLHEGSNVIDVSASAGGASTVWRVVRVGRQTLAKVPDLAGDSRDDAVGQLESLGLRAQVKEDSGFLDRFLPGGWGVCETKPDVGAELPKGSRVRLTVSKTC